MALVSVIVPVYNVEKYLPKCIESILGQTFKEFELILVDDGSTDKCGEICDMYAQEYDFVKAIHKENGGVSSARNAGLDIAQGKYIYFVDSDDCIESNLLSDMYENMQCGYDMVYFNYSFTYEDGSVRKHNWAAMQDYVLDDSSRPDFIANTVIPGAIGYSVWSRFFKKEIIENNNLRFDTKLAYAEDLLFTICYYLHAEKIAYVNQYGYCYLQREGTLTAESGNKAKFNQYNNVSRELWHYMYECRSEITYVFPLICFALICQAAENYMLVGLQERRLISANKLRALVYDDIEDKCFFEKYLNEALEKSDMLSDIYPPSELKIKKEMIEFLLGKREKLSLKTKLALYLPMKRITRILRGYGIKGIIKKLSQ